MPLDDPGHGTRRARPARQEAERGAAGRRAAVLARPHSAPVEAHPLPLAVAPDVHE